jgi:putative spermidine/putrescine transport system permease protein
MSLTDSAPVAEVDAPAERENPRKPGTPRRGGDYSRYAYLLVLPLVVFAALIFLYPLVHMTFVTLFPTDPSTGRTSFSVDAFGRVFMDEYARSLIWRSIRVGVFTTLLTLVLAFPVTLWMRQVSPRFRGVLVTVLLSPLLMSVVVRTLGWVVLLSPGGFVDNILELWGLPKPKFLYTESAIVVGQTQVFLGFAVLALLTPILKIPDNVIAAGENLGARRWQVFWRIVLPMCKPGVIAGAAIVFPLASSSYVTPALLGGSRNNVLATEVYTQAIHLLKFDRASALALVLFVIIAVGVGILGFLGSRKAGS